MKVPICHFRSPGKSADAFIVVQENRGFTALPVLVFTRITLLAPLHHGSSRHLWHSERFYIFSIMLYLWNATPSTKPAGTWSCRAVEIPLIQISAVLRQVLHYAERLLHSAIRPESDVTLFTGCLSS
ncbi:hypothetical protein CS542_06795 [Pedobacter sp. IW39]|nr:hypothetical protein CS542_06795 [Pedobacter sp. IW39]